MVSNVITKYVILGNTNIYEAGGEGGYLFIRTRVISKLKSISYYVNDLIMLNNKQIRLHGKWSGKEMYQDVNPGTSGKVSGKDSGKTNKQTKRTIFLLYIPLLLSDF